VLLQTEIQKQRSSRAQIKIYEIQVLRACWGIDRRGRDQRTGQCQLVFIHWDGDFFFGFFGTLLPLFYFKIFLSNPSKFPFRMDPPAQGPITPQ